MNDRIIIRNIEPQEITIEGAGTIAGITNVYVNGVDVTVGTKAYVIVPTKTSELTNDSGFLTSYTETDPTVPSYVKAISLADINAWNDKQDELVSGTNIKTINSNSILGSGNLNITPEYTAGYGINIDEYDTISNTITSYNDLADTPTIPTKTSDLINDSGFITNTVDDLTNYIPSSILEDILPSVSDSGSDIYLQDSAPYKISLQMNPSEIGQFTTTGKNLFNTLINKSVGYTITINGVTETYNGDGSITFEGTSTAQSDFYITTNSYPSTDTILELDTTKPYTLSLVGNTDNNIRFSIGYSTTAYHANSSTTFTPTTDIAWAFIRISNGATVNTTIYPQLELGSYGTSYEPYTGGVPAPNPDYPQDMYVVKSENSITITNKNLFDNNKVQIGVAWNNTSNSARAICLTKVQPSTKYTISYDSISGLDGLYYFGRTNEDDSTASMGVSQITSSPITITTGSTTNFIGFQFNKTSVSQDDINNVGIQLERGSTATSYVPYQSQEYPIDLEDLELTSITTSKGKYQTTIFYNDQNSPYYNSSYPAKILLNNCVYKYIANPDDNWTKVNEYGGGYHFRTTISSLNSGSYSITKCNYLNDYSRVNDSTTESWIMCNGPYIEFHLYSIPSIVTVDDFKTWITNNEVICYIARTGYTDRKNTETIDYEYPDIVIQYNNLFNNATAYSGGTNITQENDELPYDIEAKTIQKVTN